MLAAVRWGVVVLGVGAGAVSTTVLSLLVWALLAAAGVDDAPQLGLTAAIVVGFGSGGYVAGRLAPFLSRFHGSLAGLALAALVAVIARLGGSPAPTSQVLILAALGIGLGGLGGMIGGRNRKDSPDPTVNL